MEKDFDNEEEFFEKEDYRESEGYEWTEEDSWDALTDGMYGDYPSDPRYQDLAYDCMGY